LQISTEQFTALQAENLQLKQQLEQYQQAFERLQQQMKDLLRHRFGQRSERDVDSNHPQMDFLTDAAVEANTDTKADDAIDVPAHKRRKNTKKDTSNYPRDIEIIAVPDEDKHCACGGEKQVIRYETKELFDYIPAVFRIIEQRREVVACPKGCGSIQTAEAPLHVLPKVKATESLLAHIAVAKFHDRQPLYHLERYGRAVDVSRETMARWMIKLVSPLQPIFNLLKDHIIDYDISSIDATSLQVLKEPCRPATRKSYVYCLRGGPPDTPVVLYGYNALDHKPFVDNWLEGFSGTVHMDADNVFDQLLKDPAVTPSYCNAHARRYFEKVKKQAKKQGLAHEALRYYKKLYRIERQAKDEKLTVLQRHALREKNSKPLMESFYAWLKKHQPLVLPQSPLGKAFSYAIKHETGLKAFLKDGRLEIDNNLTEQQIKPLVIARKNFMFAHSVDGAHAICMHMSLIRTALANHLDPYQYYNKLLKQVPHCKTVDDYEDLLPWNLKID
jgi:transposase